MSPARERMTEETKSLFRAERSQKWISTTETDTLVILMLMEATWTGSATPTSS